MTHLGIIWQFLSGNIFGNILLFFVLIGSLLLLTVIFQAACSLANVEPPNFLKSLLIVLLTLACTVPLNGGFAYFLVRVQLNEWLGIGGVVALAFLVGFVVCVLISTVLYIVLLRISLRKGFLTAVFEQLLALLAFTLLYGIFLVILAAIQIRYGLPTNASRTLPAASTIAVAESS
jgi:hypothetical protein